MADGATNDQTDRQPERRSNWAKANAAAHLSQAELEDLEPMMKFFRFSHLAPHLQHASVGFCDLAAEVVRTQPRTPERTVCLRKLLEAKDASVRNALP